MAEFISVSSVKDFLAECPICIEQFDETSRIPRRMPCCVQSICQPCLETYSRGRLTLSCPLCRHNHHLPDGVKSLPKEPLILKILNHLKIKKGICLPCTGCPDNETAVGQCDNCGIFLCTLCKNAHVRNLVTKTHKIVTFDEMRGRPVEKFRRQHQCLEHLQPQQFYCLTCDKVICVSCTVVEHKEGKGHQVISLDEAYKEKGAIFDDLITQLDMKTRNLSQTTDQLQKKKKNLETSWHRAKTNINTEFDKLSEKLQHRRLLLLSEVDKKYNLESNMIDDALTSNTTLLTKIKSSADYTKQMRSKADKIEDLQLMSSSAGSLNTMLQETSQDIEFNRIGISFVPAHVSHLTSVISAAGLVRRVVYTPARKPNGVGKDKHYNKILMEPDVFLKVPEEDRRVTGAAGQLICPDLFWDLSTVNDRLSVSGLVIANTDPKTPISDTGCRIQSVGCVMMSRPMVVRKGEQVMFQVNVKLSIKNITNENVMIFELALVNPPIDSSYSQSGLSVQIVACSSHKQMCVKVEHNDKIMTDLPIISTQAGTSCILHLCLVLDGNNNKIHVVDVFAHGVLSTVADVSFDKPLWGAVYVDSPDDTDMRCELVPGHKVRAEQATLLCEVNKD